MASGIARLCYCRVSRFKRDRTTGLSSRTAREVTISVTTLPSVVFTGNPVFEELRSCAGLLATSPRPMWMLPRPHSGCVSSQKARASVSLQMQDLRCPSRPAFWARSALLWRSNEQPAKRSVALSCLPASFQAIQINAPIYAGAGKCCAPRVDSPSFKSTAFETIWTWAGFKPSRAAVMVIVPGVRVDRTATRLMPSSVFR